MIRGDRPCRQRGPVHQHGQVIGPLRAQPIKLRLNVLIGHTPEQDSICGQAAQARVGAHRIHVAYGCQAVGLHDASRLAPYTLLEPDIPPAASAVRRAATSGMRPGPVKVAPAARSARTNDVSSLAWAMGERSSRPTTAPVYCDPPDVSRGDNGRHARRSRQRRRSAGGSRGGLGRRPFSLSSEAWRSLPSWW